VNEKGERDHVLGIFGVSRRDGDLDTRAKVTSTTPGELAARAKVASTTPGELAE
jgi:hypothetical protein